MSDDLTDPETGLFSFRFLTGWCAPRELSLAERFDTSLACVALSFDGMADAMVLCRLAGLLRASSRHADVLCRFDERTFLFLLPNTNREGARTMGRRLTRLVAQRNLRDLTADRIELNTGVSAFPEDRVRSSRELIGRAWRAVADDTRP